MQSNNGSERVADALARFEQTILEPIVEGEVALRAAGMHEAVVELDQAFAERGTAVPREAAAQADRTAAGSEIMSERARLTVQLGELCGAARALADRSARVEPDEKRVQGEVDAFILQARELVTSLRQLEQARQQAVERAASHD